MKELLTAIVSGLVEKPEEVTVTVDEPNEEGVVYYHIHVAENDMGRVIGKQGRIAISKTLAITARAFSDIFFPLLPFFISLSLPLYILFTHFVII